MQARPPRIPSDLGGSGGAGPSPHKRRQRAHGKSRLTAPPRSRAPRAPPQDTDGNTSDGPRSAMLRGCSNCSFSCSWPSVVWSAHARTSLLKSSSPPPARRADPTDPDASASPAMDLGQAPVDSRPPLRRGVAQPPGGGHAGHCCALASAGLAPVLVLEDAPYWRAAARERRGAGADCHDVAGQPPLGRRADSRRTAQAWDCGQQSLHPPLPLARTRTLAEPDVAHIPGQPLPPPLGRGPVHGANP